MERQSSIDLGLNKLQQQFLLAVAREAIHTKLLGNPLPKYNIDDSLLNEKRGAFVTLHKDKQLRGCIGYIIGVVPLVESVRQMAIAAAFEDPRFRPVQLEEFEHLNIEISVLTPLKRVESTDEIKIGRDGLVIRKGFYQGLLLPQVAEEEGWDVEAFLQNTCLKAGLPPDSWKEPDTVIEKFSAQIFDADVLKILDTDELLDKFR
jgi:AmmeMemoRadiSam system protein A